MSTESQVTVDADEPAKLDDDGTRSAATGRSRVSRSVRIVLALLVAALPIFFIPLNPFGPELAFTASESALSLAGFSAIFAVLAYSVMIPLRFLNLPSGGHGALFGIGAYAAALVGEELGIGFFGALLTAVVLTAVAGAVMAAVSLRSRDLAFMIITLALGELVVLIMLNADGLTNGPLGIFLTNTPVVLGIEISSTMHRYYLALVALYATIAFVWWLGRSRYGRRLEAIRDNEPLARSLGLNTFRYKFSAFVISAAFAGLAGHLYFLQVRAVTPELFGVLTVIIPVILMVVMGGTRSLVGPAVGAWLITFLPAWFAPFGLEEPTRQDLFFGGLLIVFMLVAPMGIMGFVTRWWQGDRTRPAVVAAPPNVGDDAVADAAEPAAGRPPMLVAPSGSRDEPLLTVSDVSKSFAGVAAVDRVSFTLDAGEIVGIIGPNGSGKTTLVNCLTGFLLPDSGLVRYRGHDITKHKPDRRAHLGLMRTFQESMSFPESTAREHCELVEISSDEERAPLSTEEVLQLFGLEDVADVPASDLAYGHVSSLGLAAALSSGLAEVLLLDEPAAGLSAVESENLSARLRNLRDRGLTILVIDHDMSFMVPLCDRMIVLDAGSKLAEGPPAEIQRNEAVIAAYLGEKFAQQSRQDGS